VETPLIEWHAAGRPARGEEVSGDRAVVRVMERRALAAAIDGVYERTRALSGLPIEMELAHVCTVRDGKTVRIVEYNDRAQALRAAGLAE